MSFKAAGRVMCKVEDVQFSEPKFNKADPNAFDVCVLVTSLADPSQSDWWRGEYSGDYGKGNFASMTQAEITLQTLHNAGFEGDDLSTLKEQMVGKEIPATVKESESKGKVYYNVQYIGDGGGNAPVVISSDEMTKRMRALFGGKADAAPAANAEAKPKTTTPAATASKSPFKGFGK